MSEYLRTYKAVLTVLSPVFIGNGCKISKKEYIFLRNEGKVYVPGMAKFFEFLAEKGLTDKYEQYMLYKNCGLANWLYDNGIGKKEFLKWTAYTLDARNAEFKNQESIEIQTFIKDAYGCPYIPGSGLKGALRTALLADNIIQNKGKYSDDANKILNAKLSGRRKDILAEEIKNIETKAFNTLQRNPKKQDDAVNSCLSGLRISDSKPLDTNCLVLCRKIDEKPDGSKSTPNILRECLKPGTKVEFDLIIDSSITGLTPESIMEAVNNFGECYYCEFAKGFRYSLPLEKGTIFIGGGAGYATKTITYQIIGSRNVPYVSQIIDATLSNKAKKEHAHFKDRELGVSPHTLKRTYFDSRLQDIGLCKLDII